jgi:restriction endonuclease S subunit
MKLSKIATINSGVYSNTIQDGEVYYLQARDFDVDRNVVANLQPTLSYSKNLEKHFLNTGDILIVSKGLTFLSAVYDGGYSPAVASTVFLVIRIEYKQKIIPEYVSWYLNLASTQYELNSFAKGSAIPSINKTVLTEIEIPLPSIEKQHLVLKIAQLKNKEKSLQERINDLKDNKMNQLINNAIKK